MRRKLAAALLLFAAGCAKFPVSDEVKIEFRDDTRSVLVTAETTFEQKPANDETRARIENARSAAQSGTDPWSVRFSRLTPDLERAPFDGPGPRWKRRRCDPRTTRKTQGVRRAVEGVRSVVGSQLSVVRRVVANEKARTTDNR